MSTVILVLNAMISIPKIGDQIRAVLDAVFAWYITTQNQNNAHAIADAAAFALRASTQEERFEASKKWAEALSRRAPK